MSLQFEFVRWGEGKKYAVFRDKTTGKEFYVPRSRLIPTLPCELKYRLSLIHISEPTRPY